MALKPRELCPSCSTNRTVGGVLCGTCEAKKSAAMHESDGLMAKLEALGINVPARGRFTFAEACDMVPVNGKNAAQRFVEAVCRADRWTPVRGLLLEGPTGVGKSLLAVAIVRELLERGAMKLSEVRYDSSRGCWGLIKQGYGNGTANDELEARMRARLWVLDDIGAEHPTEDTGLNLTEILTARELKPTIMTANIPREHQGERWDPQVWERIKSRLGERNFKVVTMTGPDHRLLGAA